jgi:hypothetical protein
LSRADANKSDQWISLKPVCRKSASTSRTNRAISEREPTTAQTKRFPRLRFPDAFEVSIPTTSSTALTTKKAILSGAGYGLPRRQDAVICISPDSSPIQQR